ncbi:two-component system response regulator [Leptospira perolatii]|uniref:Two-component system response regulator n=1 Tax=Leptospira perolatii TaxID=2023191 RepID=A0A2M9ZS90_9LEPT|nr:response regulator [Leptospira perolatii]PJZ71398.1 two-component system response regulator [Leptospira perolatii]PJZ74932.1 two-component system response regulator [Leptospira perolatii]
MKYQSYRVLVAEDDETTAELLQRFLEQYNFEVDHVVDGMAAELKLRKEVYDLILLDNRMPVMTGLRLVNRIPDRNRQTPIIFLTASNEKEDIVNAASSKQLAAYIIKPFQPDQLLDRICKAIGIQSNQLVNKRSFPFTVELAQKVSYGVGAKLNGCPYNKNAERIVQEVAFVLKELPEPRKFFLEIGPQFYFRKNAKEILSSVVTRLASKYEIPEEDILVIDQP